MIYSDVKIFISLFFEFVLPFRIVGNVSLQSLILSVFTILNLYKFEVKSARFEYSLIQAWQKTSPK